MEELAIKHVTTLADDKLNQLTLSIYLEYVYSMFEEFSTVFVSTICPIIVLPTQTNCSSI